MESTIKQEVEKKLQDKQKSKEFKDVGRVSNTRKELAAYRLVNIDNLKDMEQDSVVAFNMVKKENVWKWVDVASEKEKGTSPGAAYLKVEIRKSLPAKPKDGEGFRKAYVLALTTLQNDLEPCRTVEEIYNLCNKYRSFTVYDFTINFVEALPEGVTKEAWEEISKKKLGYFRVSKALTEGLGVRFYNLISRSSDAAVQTWKEARELDPVSEEQAALVIENLNKRKEKSIESISTQIKSYREADIPALKQILLREFNKDGWINKNFKALPEDSRRLAINYRENQLKTLIEAYDKQISEAKAKDGDWSWSLKEETAIEDGEKVKKVKGKSINTKSPLSYIKRTGGFAITDISVQSIVDNFGFTSVNYGNYVDDKWSKDHTKHFLGAMSDFGEILNIDIKTLTQLGGLNIAFGAKGRPGHLATYFPQTKDINLTRGNGDGSLAHEYGHYIDNVLMEGKSKSTASLFISDTKRSDSPILNRLFQELVDFMIRGEQGITPLLPVRFYPQKQKDVPTIYYRSYMAVIELKGTIEETLAQEEVKKICVLDNQYHSTQNRVFGYIIDAFGLDYYDVPLRLKTSHFYYKSAYNAFNYNTLVDGKYKITSDERTKYWTSIVELFARAFETVILKKFLDKNRVSNYLVADIETEDIISEHYFAPYPTGKELEKIEGIIDEIILNIKQHYSIGDFVPPSELREDEYIDLSESGLNESGMVVEDKNKGKQITFVEEDKTVKVVNVEHWQMSLEDFLNENKEYKKLIEKTKDYDFRLIEARKKDTEAYSKKSQVQIARSMNVGRFDKNESTVKERINENDKKIKELKGKLESEHKNLVLAAIKEGKEVPEMNVVLYNPPAEKTIDPNDKATFIEKRLKALNISARFSKDELLNKRIKALELSLRMIGKKSKGDNSDDLLLFHGSQTKFKDFDSSLVTRTDYGWGLYFTESEDVAKYYARRPFDRPIIAQKIISSKLPNNEQTLLIDTIRLNLLDFDKSKKTLDKKYYPLLDEIEKEIKNKAFVYKIKVVNPKWLNWDKPVSADVLNLFKDLDNEKIESGEDLYYQLVKSTKSEKNASLLLKEKGFSGIKYLMSNNGFNIDGYNYVLFGIDDLEITNVEKFRTGGTVPVGFNMEMEAKAIQWRTGMPIDLESLRKEGQDYVFKYKGQSRESRLSAKLVQDTISMNRKSLEGRLLYAEGGGVDSENKFTFISNSAMQRARALSVLEKGLNVDGKYFGRTYEWIESLPTGLEIGTIDVSSRKTESGVTTKLAIGDWIVGFKAEQDYYKYLQNGGYPYSKYLKEEQEKAKIEKEKQDILNAEQAEKDKLRIKQEDENRIKYLHSIYKIALEQGQEAYMNKMLNQYDKEIEYFKSQKQTKEVRENLDFYIKQKHQATPSYLKDYKTIIKLYKIVDEKIVEKYNWKVGDKVLVEISLFSNGEWKDVAVETQILDIHDNGSSGKSYRVEKKEGMGSPNLSYMSILPTPETEKKANSSNETPKEALKTSNDSSKLDLIEKRLKALKISAKVNQPKEKDNHKVYRGTGERINETYGGISDDGIGTFYTDNTTMARWFAGLIEYDVESGKYEPTNNKGKVENHTINLKKPYVIDEKHKDYDIDYGYDSFQIYMREIESNGGVEKYRSELQKKGYDGIILKGNETNYYEDGTYNIYITFDKSSKDIIEKRIKALEISLKSLNKSKFSINPLDGYGVIYGKVGTQLGNKFKLGIIKENTVYLFDLYGKAISPEVNKFPNKTESDFKNFAKFTKQDYKNIETIVNSKQKGVWQDRSSDIKYVAENPDKIILEIEKLIKKNKDSNLKYEESKKNKLTVEKGDVLVSTADKNDSTKISLIQSNGEVYGINKYGSEIYLGINGEIIGYDLQNN